MKQNKSKCMTDVVHHYHKRKRIHEKHEQYPNPDKYKRSMDKLIYIIAILFPIMLIPQVLKIWIMKTAEGLSLITWISYVVFTIFWIIYGFLHKEKPIIITNLLFLVLHSLIMIGIIIYG